MQTEPIERTSKIEATRRLPPPPIVRAWFPRRIRRFAARLIERIGRWWRRRPARHDRGTTHWSRFPPDQPPWMRTVREIALCWIVFPALRLLYRVDVVGRERLAGTSGPLILAANHCLHLDNPMILLALPAPVRRVTAIAAAEDSIFASWRGRWAVLFGNAFPISRGRAPRRSLARIEAVLAEGYTVLLYPEGKLTVGGPIQPFKLGVGFLAVETGAPVAPVLLDVRRLGLAEGRLWPPRGHVRIVFGRPLRCGPSESPSVATSRIEAAVRALASE
jgi:1-acyl-sn-glycerol-3-phosphate acyltransferase